MGQVIDAVLKLIYLHNRLTDSKNLPYNFSPIPECMAGMSLLSNWKVYHIDSLIRESESCSDQKIRRAVCKSMKVPFLPKYMYVYEYVCISIHTHIYNIYVYNLQWKSNTVSLGMTSKMQMISSITFFNSLVCPIRGWTDLWETISFQKLNYLVTPISVAAILGIVSLLKSFLGTWYATTDQKKNFFFFLPQ